MDREKVIIELEQCLDDSIDAVVPADTVRDAIALLKAQEPEKEKIPEYPCKNCCSPSERAFCCGCEKERQWQTKYGKQEGGRTEGERMTEHKGLNLCDICGKNYPECDSNVCGMTFGSGTGNDNVISCAWYRNPVGNAMRTAREKYGISQNKLGELSGVPARNINFWERGGGNPPIMAIMRIANTLGVTIDVLVGVKR